MLRPASLPVYQPLSQQTHRRAEPARWRDPYCAGAYATLRISRQARGASFNCQVHVERRALKIVPVHLPVLEPCPPLHTHARNPTALPFFVLCVVLSVGWLAQRATEHAATNLAQTNPVQYCGVCHGFHFLGTSETKVASLGPAGYILAYGVAYKNVVYEGEELVEVPSCPPSATAVHAAFVSECAFSPAFLPTLDTNVTASGMVEDVRRVAKAMASHDVAVLYFSGHGQRMGDTTCVIDGAGGVVSVRKLQAVFADTVAERGLRSVALVIILDCCQTFSTGKCKHAGWRRVCWGSA